jgi:hypothetical protein
VPGLRRGLPDVAVPFDHAQVYEASERLTDIGDENVAGIADTTGRRASVFPEMGTDKLVDLGGWQAGLHALLMRFSQVVDDLPIYPEDPWSIVPLDVAMGAHGSLTLIVRDTYRRPRRTRCRPL